VATLCSRENERGLAGAIDTKRAFPHSLWHTIYECSLTTRRRRSRAAAHYCLSRVAFCDFTFSTATQEGKLRGKEARIFSSSGVRILLILHMQAFSPSSFST